MAGKIRAVHSSEMPIPGRMTTAAYHKEIEKLSRALEKCFVKTLYHLYTDSLVDPRPVVKSFTLTFPAVFSHDFAQLKSLAVDTARVRHIVTRRGEAKRGAFFAWTSLGLSRTAEGVREGEGEVDEL